MKEQLNQTLALAHQQVQLNQQPSSAKRAQAFEQFSALGFPTTKNEEWKYLNLNGVLAKDYQLNAPFNQQSVADLLQKNIITNFKANRLVFVNGIYSAQHSTILEQNGDVIICSMVEAQQKHADLFDAHFGKYANTNQTSLNALNQALFTDGLFVYAPAGKTSQYPLSVIFVTDSGEAAVMAQPRNLVVLQENASLTLIESYYHTGEKSAFTNVVNEVYVGAYAQLEHYKLQREKGEAYQNNFTQIFQEKNTQINHVTLTLNGEIVRNNLHFYMNGENANSLLYGLYIPRENQLVDNHTRVDHAKPNCMSDEKYKGILKDKAVGVFNGKIVVHEDAQKTNAYQRNQNILLSDEATINTKPQLEIFADDVKCTHGATIGQLDEEPMFYLRSRGIPEAAAKKMLLNAFADDIAEKIKIPQLVALLEAQIDQKI